MSLGVHVGLVSVAYFEAALTPSGLHGVSCNEYAAVSDTIWTLIFGVVLVTFLLLSGVDVVPDVDGNVFGVAVFDRSDTSE